jgi:hypothetical protein
MNAAGVFLLYSAHVQPTSVVRQGSQTNALESIVAASVFKSDGRKCPADLSVARRCSW